MVVGVPREIKKDENRVGITPAGAMALAGKGHQVIVETGAGEGSGFTDEEFRAAGAETVTREELFARADMILKVKEPLSEEYDYFRPGQVLFAYLHLAADRKLTQALVQREVVAIAYETVQLTDGSLPLLTPMSEVAGRMAVQIGAHFLEKRQGGRGVLLGGVPGVPPAEVVIIGGGTVGTNAAKIALGMGARVSVVDINAERLRYLDDLFRGQVTTLVSNAYNLGQASRRADLLIGAVLIPGARAPQLVTEDMVREMKPRAVIVDVAIDQGGCVATMDRVTTHSSPTFLKHGVLHYAVANIPGAVPRTSTIALTNTTLPWVLRIVDSGWEDALRRDPALARGLNVCRGQVTHAGVAEAHGFPYVPPAELGLTQQV